MRLRFWQLALATVALAGVAFAVLVHDAFFFPFGAVEGAVGVGVGVAMFRFARPHRSFVARLWSAMLSGIVAAIAGALVGAAIYRVFWWWASGVVDRVEDLGPPVSFLIVALPSAGIAAVAGLIFGAGLGQSQPLVVNDEREEH